MSTATMSTHNPCAIEADENHITVVVIDVPVIAEAFGTSTRARISSSFCSGSQVQVCLANLLIKRYKRKQQYTVYKYIYMVME